VAAHVNPSRLLWWRVCSYDSRVKAMEVEEKPKEEYGDIGGLDKQIEVRVASLPLNTRARIPRWPRYAASAL
jgi:ATP-dependent 26S proteasome regulatory subunit